MAGDLQIMKSGPTSCTGRKDSEKKKEKFQPAIFRVLVEIIVGDEDAQNSGLWRRILNAPGPLPIFNW